MRASETRNSVSFDVGESEAAVQIPTRQDIQLSNIRNVSTYWSDTGTKRVFTWMKSVGNSKETTSKFTC